MSVRQPGVMVMVACLLTCGLSSVVLLAQGPGGEIKPKPSASPTPRQPTRVAPKPPRITGPTPVRIAKVVEQTVAETLNATGVVSAAETVSVPARVSGILAKISVQEGSAVKRGDAVAQIDDSGFRANEERAQNALEQAQSQAASLPAGSNKRAAADYLVRQRQAEHDNAVAQLADCVVSAPVDGVVRLVRVAQGQTLLVGSPLFDVAAADQLRVRVDTSNIKANDVQVKQIAIRVGQTARVSDEQAAYVAHVERVITSPVNPKRITSVDIVLAKNGSLQLDDRVRVEIDMEPTTVVTVPKEAVVKLGRANKVLIVENGKAIERLVTTGRVGPDWVEIRSGLKLGQSVVTAPGSLQSGQTVTVSN
jgi:membrane fusion protein (multidrug efflux system)